MEEQLITFEIAKLANKKGFIGWSEKRYNKKGTFNESKAWSISAPTQSLLQKWLREVHNIHLSVRHVIDNYYIIEMTYPETRDKRFLYKLIDTHFKIYEEALEKGLIEALKLI